MDTLNRQVNLWIYIVVDIAILVVENPLYLTVTVDDLIFTHSSAVHGQDTVIVRKDPLINNF